MTDRDRLALKICNATQKTNFACRNTVCKSKGKCAYCLVMAEDLIANGVIVPKYKVGDTVWYITGIHRSLVKSAIVEEIIINCNGVSDLLVTSDTATFENSVDIFYPTKEEAEQKSKELK